MKEIVNTIIRIDNMKKEIGFANPAWEFDLPIFLAVMLSVLLGLIFAQFEILAAIGWKKEAKIWDTISFRSKMTFVKIEL